MATETMKKPPKRKKKTISSLRKLAWGHFSIYVRLRDSDKDGVASCSTCGRLEMAFGTGRMSAGHFIPQKQCPALVFNEDNCHIQCSSCNGPGMGQQFAMGRYIDDSRNDHKILSTSDMLYGEYVKHKEGNLIFKWTRAYLDNIISDYSERNAEILKSKNFKLKAGSITYDQTNPL